VVIVDPGLVRCWLSREFVWPRESECVLRERDGLLAWHAPVIVDHAGSCRVVFDEFCQFVPRHISSVSAGADTESVLVPFAMGVVGDSVVAVVELPVGAEGGDEL